MLLCAAMFSFSGDTTSVSPNLGFLVTRYFGAMIGIEEGDPNNKAHWVMVLAFEQEPFLLTDI